MKIFKLIIGFFLTWSKSSKIMQNVIFYVTDLKVILQTIFNNTKVISQIIDNQNAEPDEQATV